MKHIVIYEEDYLTRTLLRDWLSKAGYRVRGGTPQGPARDSTADLVIASVYMKNNADVQSIRAIQARHPGTPLIVISGQFRSGLCADGATAQSLEVRRVIAKPLNHGDLLEAVQDIIGVPK